MVFGAVFNMNGEGILLNFLIISSQKERPCWVWSLGVLDLSCPHFDLKTLLFLGTANFVGRFSVTVPKPLIRPEEFASTKILGSHKKWLPLSAMSSFVRSGHPVIPYWESVCLMDWWPNHHDVAFHGIFRRHDNKIWVFICGIPYLYLVGGWGIPTPLKNDGVRQIGSSSQLLGKIKFMFQTTNQL